VRTPRPPVVVNSTWEAGVAVGIATDTAARIEVGPETTTEKEKETLR
jgi:hypothetical protein